MRARTSQCSPTPFPILSEPSRTCAALLPLLRGFSKAYRTFSLLLSPPLPLSAFSYFRRPLSFPRFPRAQPRYRTVASVPSFLISDRRRSHARRTACVPWEPFAPLFPRLLHFPTDRENSLTLAPLFVTFHCGHALLFSGHGHASKQYIRRAPCTVVSSDSI